VKALGKGSVASIVKVALTLVWWALWTALGGIALVVAAYGVLHALIAANALDRSVFVANPDLAELVNMRWELGVSALVIGAVFVIGALVIVGRLRRLFDSFTSGEPFRRENATHLRVIWITMLAMELARYLLLAGAAAMFAAAGLPPGIDADFNIHFDFSTWLSIAVLIVLAEVFREGARMKEEQELTI
jgi:hypothetical protein